MRQHKTKYNILQDMIVVSQLPEKKKKKIACFHCLSHEGFRKISVNKEATVWKFQNALSMRDQLFSLSYQLNALSFSTLRTDENALSKSLSNVLCKSSSITKGNK